MEKTTWVLGASDPEMETVERLLRSAGETVAYATVAGVRVHPGNAYTADGAVREYRYAGYPASSCGTRPEIPARVELGPLEAGERVVYVETTLPEGAGGFVVDARCDHHRPGDPGFGRPSAEFLAASSVGQVIALLAQRGSLVALGWARSFGGKGRGFPGSLRAVRSVDPTVGILFHGVSDADSVEWEIPQAVVMAAAADHCLAAAYAGQCPGVEPEALMRWRAETRAAFQKRTVEAVLADVESARKALRRAPLALLVAPTAAEEKDWGTGLDMRPEVAWGAVADMRPGKGAGCGAHSILGPARLESAARSLGDLADLQRPCDGNRPGCWSDVPELPEAAAREGMAFIAIPKPGADARRKVVLQAASPEQVAAFLRGEGISAGLTDRYGDPARGFAGGYLK